jgi:hypothetical protein
VVVSLRSYVDDQEIRPVGVTEITRWELPNPPNLTDVNNDGLSDEFCRDGFCLGKLSNFALLDDCLTEDEQDMICKPSST